MQHLAEPYISSHIYHKMQFFSYFFFKGSLNLTFQTFEPGCHVAWVRVRRCPRACGVGVDHVARPYLSLLSLQPSFAPFTCLFRASL